ncbi:Metallo-dependent phosphatase-like protein [Thamnocephalis sphaerospora]|uniref:Metallo-dependent phosphatase-like protein n=1 Tax=Thamnocephalis sphaerospora TaxID=78915 RepID=A0A4P9XWL9_9FUNG|nr:Metallo-dependent phosphatase-like protein [Thamnocephalis sphaerospora]|eukprot:RKP10734.1 Metallo-dependent phosphatase-like protein [Thamnocephalis sphaerospora]
MPPVLTKDNRRYLPAHLLKRVENALGAFEVVTTDNGLSLLIGDDGGARPLRDPILYARCWDAAKTSRLAGKAPQYEDPNHKTFRLASGLEKRRIVAVGDLHGDYESTLSVLRLARVVDGEGKWAGGSNTIFVQTGDILDRGPDSIQLLELFPRLVREANAVGGRVIQIMGNHEVMNLIGDWRYVSEDEKGFSNAAMRRAAFSTLGRYGNRLSRLPVVHQIGDTVFAHGGITPEWSNVNLHKINKHATDKLHEFIAAEEADKPIPLPTVFGPDGPTWYRGYAQGPEPRVCALLKSALAIMGAKRMVVGHTMQRDGGILSRCKGQFFVIDVGISRALQNYQAALEILPGGIVNAIYPYGVISMIKRKAYEGQP